MTRESDGSSERTCVKCGWTKSVSTFASSSEICGSCQPAGARPETIFEPVDERNRGRRSGGPDQRCEVCAMKKSASEFSARSKICTSCERAQGRVVRVVPGGAPGRNRKR